MELKVNDILANIDAAAETYNESKMRLMTHNLLFVIHVSLHNEKPESRDRIKETLISKMMRHVGEKQSRNYAETAIRVTVELMKKLGKGNEFFTGLKFMSADDAYSALKAEIQASFNFPNVTTMMENVGVKAKTAKAEKADTVAADIPDAAPSAPTVPVPATADPVKAAQDIVATMTAEQVAAFAAWFATYGNVASVPSETAIAA